MRKPLILSALAAMLSLAMNAQDDMYFVPTKKNVEKTKSDYGMPKDTYYSGSKRSIDEYNRRNRSCDCTILRRCDLHILRTHNNFHQPSMLDIIHTGKFRSAETHLELVCHDARKNITLADKVCNKCIFRLILYILRSSDLLHTSFGHDNDLVRHRKCLLLVVCYIDKGNAKSFMHTFQFKLHLLAHL